MKIQIYTDSSAANQLFGQIEQSREVLLTILRQYARTSLKPLAEIEDLKTYLADPVKYVGSMVQKSANLGGWSVKPEKMVELLDEPEVNKLIAITKGFTPNETYLGLMFGKFTKAGFDVDLKAFQKYVEEQTTFFADTPKEIKAYEATKKIIEALQDLKGIGISYNTIVNQPLNNVLLKYSSEEHPPTLNYHTFKAMFRD